MATQIIYTDAALTTPLAGNIVIPQRADDSLPPVDVRLWLGHNNAAQKIQAESDPGVDQIVISVNDTDPGNGNPATAVKLAATQAGLNSAVAGDPLNAGVEIVGGAGGAFEFWMRVEDLTNTIGTYTDLIPETNNCVLVAVS